MKHKKLEIRADKETSRITIQNKDRDRFYNMMSPEQHRLFDSIQKNVFTFVESKAGTGKSTVTIAAMLDMLISNQIGKIVYIQSCSERFLKHGFLPGTTEEKTANMYVALYDAFATLGMTPWDVQGMINNEKIVLKTDSDLRGCNFEESGVILDECQNMDFQTLKLILTRIHDTCHVCMMGDRLQKDNCGNNTAFIGYGTYLAKKFGEIITLTRNYRGQFSKAAENYEETYISASQFPKLNII